MLSVIGVLIAAAFLVGDIVCWRWAPAVTAACAGGLSVGGWAVYVVVKHGGPDAPVTVTLAVSGGLGLAGLVGLLATPRGDARSLRTLGIKVFVAAPTVATALAASLETACPMYDESPSAGVCQYSLDVLGGWLGPTGVPRWARRSRHRTPAARVRAARRLRRPLTLRGIRSSTSRPCMPSSRHYRVPGNAFPMETDILRRSRGSRTHVSRPRAARSR